MFESHDFSKRNNNIQYTYKKTMLNGAEHIPTTEISYTAVSFSYYIMTFCIVDRIILLMCYIYIERQTFSVRIISCHVLIVVTSIAVNYDH